MFIELHFVDIFTYNSLKCIVWPSDDFIPLTPWGTEVAVEETTCSLPLSPIHAPNFFLEYLPLSASTQFLTFMRKPFYLSDLAFSKVGDAYGVSRIIWGTAIV